MLGRRILLALGCSTLVAGLALSVVWMRTPADKPQVVAAAPREAFLTVTRAIKARSLLRPDDLGWTTLSPDEVPIGAYRRGQVVQADFAGAVVRGDLRPGEVVTAERIVRANEPGFLPAVLGEGKRAMSIAVNPAEGAAGLIVPGDRVDVVLTQNLAEAGVSVSRRSVGETVLSDLRVIAIDQTTTNEPRPKGNEARAVTVEPRLAKTVTLEVSVRQAETLLVAQQLGKIQLTLRNASEAGAFRPASSEPTWGSDVSPALRSLEGSSEPLRLPSDAGKKRSTAVEIMHGDRNETRCFNAAGQPATDCEAGSPARPATPATPATTAPVVPGAAVLPPTLTRSL